MSEPLDLDTSPKVVASPPAVAATSSSITPGATVAPPGYPSNPAGPPVVNPGPGQGQPQAATSFSQGISFLSPCPTCGIAYQPDQLGAHAQTHGQNFYSEGSDFGQRTARLDDSGRYTLKS